MGYINNTRQRTQLRSSDLYDDTIAAGVAMETGATSGEFDYNALRSQTNRVIDATMGGNWYDDVPTVNSKKRGLLQLNTDLDDIEEKRILCGVQVLTNVSVPATQNYVVLSQASSETPTDSAAIGTGLGAVVAVLGTDVGSHSLDEITGKNAITPKNLVVVRDATTKDPITSGGHQVFGLLQAESGTVQDDAFNDTDKQVQISFVRNNGSDDLEAVPVADIESTTVEYLYGKRINLDALPEDCNFPPNFADQVASVDVTLDSAIDNQSGAATQAQDIDVRITDTFSWSFQDSTGASDIFQVNASASGDNIVSNADWDINNTNSVDMSQGLQLDTADQIINLGHTAAGQIDTPGNMTISATGGSSDLTLSAGLEMKFVDGNKSGSTYAGDLKLAETSGEWDAYEVAFGGEVSLLNAITQAKTSSSGSRTDYQVSSAIAADTDTVPGSNLTLVNGSNQDLSTLDFINEVRVEVNGDRVIPGANAAADNGVYPGTDLSVPNLKFEFELFVDDGISVYSNTL
jgi:hypothetical protein